MRRGRRAGGLRVALACACALLALGLLGAPAALAADETEEDFDVLSSRYGTLDELANSLNEDEAVVVDTRIGVLVAANQALDGAQVRFEGEALGEAVQASGGNVWVAVGNTAGQSISVLMSEDDAETIGMYGSYQATGSTIQVTGTYHVACDEHQGELEVHADAVELVVEGSVTQHTVSAKRLRTGVALCVLGVALVMAYELLRRRADRSDGPRARGAEYVQEARGAQGAGGEQVLGRTRAAGGERKPGRTR